MAVLRFKNPLGQWVTMEVGVSQEIVDAKLAAEAAAREAVDKFQMQLIQLEIEDRKKADNNIQEQIGAFIPIDKDEIINLPE